METFVDIQRQYQDRLSSIYEEGEVKELFLMALEHVSGMRRSQFLAQRHERISEIYKASLLAVLARLTTGQPIQHILGKAEFYGMHLKVTADTLIPRPETEELVQRILNDYLGQPSLKLIDIGTGSGCIAVALAKHLQQSEVWAMDISCEAVAVARHNAVEQQQSIHFLCADILEWELTFPPDQRFDIIVSNPPYITPREQQSMHINVLQYEPHTALFVDDEAPLLYYAHIADFALQHLTEEGSLYFEINQYLGKETADLLRKKGFERVDILQDLHKNDRIAIAKKG